MALNFPRTGGSDAVKSTAPFDHNTAYTVLMWWKNPTLVTDYQHAFHVGLGETYATNTDLFGVANNGQQLMAGSAGGSPSEDFPGGLPYVAPSTTEFWVAMVRESTTVLKFYYGTDDTDGALFYTSTMNVGSRAAANTMMIGGFSSLPFAGDIALPRIWTRALTLTELHTEVTSSTPMDATGIYSAPAFAGANLAAALIDTSAGGHDWTDLSSGAVTVTTMAADSLPDLGGAPSWTDIPGATSLSYTTPTLSSADNGKQYRAVLTNIAGSATSAAATLTVTAGAAVLSPPLLTRTKTIYAPTLTGGAVPSTITVNTLDFAEGSNIRMRMALAAGLRTDGCTIIWREKRRTQDVYSGGFVFNSGTGSWDAGAWTALFVTHGCDGTYDSDGQKSATSGPGMYHEIAGMKSIPNGWDSRDFISRPSALGTQASYPVVYDEWVERAVVIKPVSTTLEHYNYVDFSDPTKVIQQNLLTSDPATPTNQYLDFGAPHWIADGSEDFDGQATHIKVFSRGLSTAEIRQELDNFSDTPVVSDCWYSNYSPSHTDLTDKKPSGTAHPFTWHNGTATTVTADFDLPVTDQTLTPPLLTRTKTIYAPVVTVGAVSVAPTLLARTKTLYVPTVSVGAVTVSPGLLTRSKVLYTPSVSVGAVALTPPLLTRSKTLYAPVVSQDGSTQTLTPPLLTLAKVIYAPVVVPGAVSLEPALLTRTKTIYAPTVTQGAATLTPPLLVRDKVIYAPVVTGGAVAVLRKRAGAIRRNYLIQGKRFTLSDFELRLLLQQLTPARAEVQVVEKEDVKQISRKLWKRLRETDSALDALTLKQVDAVVQDATIEYDEDEELVMLLL
jgi:hypothetical protein